LRTKLETNPKCDASNINDCTSSQLLQPTTSTVYNKYFTPTGYLLSDGAMSSNTPVLSQCKLSDTHFDAEPSSCCLFSHGFTIFDEDASQLNELDSEQVLVPTEYQQTNADSYIAVAEPEQILDSPFDYTWVVWECYSVRGYTKPVHSV
jgi:hypothetical protein